MLKTSVRKVIILSLFLILALCYQSDPVSFAEEATTSSDPTGSKTPWVLETEDLTVNLAEKGPLYIEAKTTEDGSILAYSSSNEKLAAVNSETGELTLKSAGTVTIKVTAKEDVLHTEATAEAKVTIYKLDAPKIYKISNAQKGVRITWSDVSDSKGYIVYRREYVKDRDKVNAVEKSTEESSVTESSTEKQDSTDSTGTATASKAESSSTETTKANASDATTQSESTTTEPTEETTAEIKEKVQSAEINDGWKELKKFTSRDSITMVDTTAKNGVYYEYAVIAFKQDYKSIKSKPEKIVFLSTPTSVKISKVSSTKKKISWAKNSSCSGYNIQYAKHRTMIACTEKTIKKGSTTAYTASKLSKNKDYYARVRAYVKVDGNTYTSAWGATSNCLSNKTVSITSLKYKTKDKKNKTVMKTLDIPKAAKQGVYDHSVMQGGCTDGTYGYYALIDKNGTDKLTDDTQKIAKIKLSTGKLVKLSACIPLDHANDMTYDSTKKRIVVLHNLGGSDKVKKRVTFVDPKTLKATGKKDIVIPNKLEGNSASKLKQINGLCSIAYNKKRQQYVFLVSGAHNLLFTDKDLNPIKFVRIDESQKTDNDYWYCQGMDCTNYFIYVSVSPKSGNKYNTILMYDWAGNLKCKISVKKGYEIENIFHVSDKWYAGFYTFHKVGNKYIRSGYVYKFSNF